MAQAVLVPSTCRENAMLNHARTHLDVVNPKIPKYSFNNNTQNLDRKLFRYLSICIANEDHLL